MSEKTVWQKLLIKPGRSVLLVNAPADAAALLGELPPDAIAPPEQPQVNAILLFVRERAELEANLPAVKSRLLPGGMIWVFYYKLTSKQSADINRDNINAFAATLGMQGVAMISVNNDWSALRLKLVP